MSTMRRRAWLALAVTAVAGAGLVLLEAPDGAVTTQPAPGVPVAAPPPVAAEGPSSAPPARIPIEVLRARAEDAGLDEQVHALADGVITFDEYAGAITTALDCARGRDVEVSGPSPDWSGVTLAYAFSSESRETSDAALERHDACYSRHALYVDIAYQTSEVVERERRVVFRRIVDCLEIQGVAVSIAGYDPPRLFRVRDTHRESFDYCIEASRSDPRSLALAPAGAQ